MSMWTAVLLASAIAFGLKLIGYLIPAHLLEGPRTKRITAALPVALLAALVATQTFTSHGGTLVLDARAAAVGVAVVALLLRAPFIVVVIAGALTAAGLRGLGLA
jgi:branched-subunit amino acid transport protein